MNRIGTRRGKGRPGPPPASRHPRNEPPMTDPLRLAVLALLAATTLVSPAQSNFATVRTDDPVMAAAKQKARETLPGFLTLAKAPRPSTEGFSVKVGIRDRGHTEFFWITSFEHKDGRFSGTINNELRNVRNVRFGERITFTDTEIADWLYIDDGKMKSNYTGCAILKHEPAKQREAYKKRVGLDCDF
jgi:uncharacterized protein YegJ (DUF2314 family)